MKNYTVRRYTNNDYDDWNAFVKSAKNATFLFHRDFIEYHADRFEDFSMMVFDGNKIAAVLPANKCGDEVFSHQGLTYGGLVFGLKTKLPEALNLFRVAMEFLHSNQIKKLQLKVIPSIYCNGFCDEAAYILFCADAKLVRRDSLSVVDLQSGYRFSSDREKCAVRGQKANLEIKEEANFEAFWNEILIPNLQNRHGVKPVHSVEEISKLQKLFPANIRQFNVYQDQKIIAGTTIFESELVAHPQYISGNELKNETGSLDFLYSHLIKNVFKHKKYFDLGPSNEQNGRKINAGMLFWKESFGAKTVAQDFYDIDTANYSQLATVLS